MSARRLVLVRLAAPDGTSGRGEAAPLPTYDGVTVEDVCDALERCRRPLSESDGEDRAALLAACAEHARLPQALAALDMALWDLAGRRSGQPVWRLLGAAEPPPLAVNATIAVADPALAAREASVARARGFRCVKVKVGLGDDLERVAAVRAAAGPNMAIRLDANGAWSASEAIAALGALEPVGIELCEEPTSGLAALERVSAQAAIPIALDESAAESAALDRRVCDAVCLKISRHGGISGALEAGARARSAGYRLYLASTLDGPLGIAAAIHAAAVLRPELASGLATLALFAEHGNPLPVNEGTIRPPAGPGLGRSLSAWYG